MDTNITTAMLPHDENVEKAMLNAIVNYGTATIIVDLKEDFFYNPLHREIFNTVQELNADGKAIDIVTIASECMTKKRAVDIGDLMNLDNYALSTGIDTSVETWYTILEGLFIKRKIVALCDSLGKMAYDMSVLPLQLVEHLHQNMVDVTGRGRKDRSAHEIGMNTIKELETAPIDGIAGIAFSGIKALDYQLNGAEKGDLIIIGARPSMGKTMLAYTCINHCYQQGLKVLAWGLEMTSEKNLKMLVSNACELDYRAVTRGGLNHSDLAKATHFIDGYQQSNRLHLLDKTGVNVGQIRAKIIQYRDKHGVDIVFIDHGSLIRKNMMRGSNGEAEIELITNILKELAKDLEIPIVLLWQLNRQNEQRGTKMPQLSDLRGSGAIEQDADKIIFIHRPYYYDKEQPEDEALFNNAKNRNGETGIIKVSFKPSRARFESYDDSCEFSDYEETQTMPKGKPIF